MKKRTLLWMIPLILITGCSSIPKKNRVIPINVQKEKASLYLDRGHNEYRWDNFESAIHLYGKAFSIASSVDWLDGMTRSLIHLSRSYDRLGQSELSHEFLERAEDILNNVNSELLTAIVMNRKTEWLLFNDSPQSALKNNDQTIKETENLTGEDAGEVWRIRATILKAMKSYEPALEALTKALNLDEKGNFISETASDYYIMASIYSLIGNKEKAVDSMKSALEKDKYIENTPAIAQDLYAMGLIYEKVGDNKNAFLYYDRSYLVYKSFGKDSVPDKLIRKFEGSEETNPWPSVFNEF